MKQASNVSRELTEFLNAARSNGVVEEVALRVYLELRDNAAKNTSAVARTAPLKVVQRDPAGQDHGETTKRKIAVEKRMKFLLELYKRTSRTWTVLRVNRMFRTHKIRGSITWLVSNDILERRGRSLHWTGPAPSPKMAADWLDFFKTYMAVRRDEALPIPLTRPSTEINTHERRIDQILEGLKKVHSRLFRSYLRVNLGNLIKKQGLQVGCAPILRDAGIIDTVRKGTSKWVGRAPDTEMAEMLSDKLANRYSLAYQRVLVQIGTDEQARNRPSQGGDRRRTDW